MRYVEQLRELNETVEATFARRAGTELDPGSETATLQEIARGIRLFQAEQVAIAARCQAAGAFVADGFKDATSWMKANHGVSGREARTVGDAASAALASPAVADALASGAIGAENAASLKDLAEHTAAGNADKAVLDGLLARATQQSDMFRKDVKRSEIYGAGLDEEAIALRRRARSKVTSFPGDGGMMSIFADLDPERHALVINALDAIVDETWRAGRATTLGAFASAQQATSVALPRKSLGQLRADALVEMARRAMAGGDERPTSSPNRQGEAQIAVLIDYETLRDGVRRSGSTCELDDGTPLSPQSVRRLACNAGIIPVVMNGASEVLDVGRRRRLATRAQILAARVRSGTCVFPGCDVPAKRCELHHIQWWYRDHGETNLENLAPVCDHHHSALHEGGWTLTRTRDGTVTVRGPDGRVATDERVRPRQLIGAD